MMIAFETILVIILMIILAPLIAIYGFIRGQRDLLLLMREEKLIHLVEAKKVKTAKRVTKRGGKKSNKVAKKR